MKKKKRLEFLAFLLPSSRLCSRHKIAIHSKRAGRDCRHLFSLHHHTHRRPARVRARHQRRHHAQRHVGGFVGDDVIPGGGAGWLMVGGGFV